MLKSLELFGFKSFADRTLFEFAPGITCVVGPNGSGKSNVVDAIKWILGDQSAKSLRGKEMSDVIFNGSSGRKGSGFAEATLSFENVNNLLPIEAAEVQIGRRLYQSGDSEYLLNGNPVRLKDIRDLFMGTGAGTAAYSIIEQGRVDQILQTNPISRRLVFEEAAGISKFKARRVDAERRLERVAQNLLRLTDIVDQVESQLTSTRSQASKAAKYRELSVELKKAWTGLAADDCRVLTQQREERQSVLNECVQQLATLQQQVQEIESEKRVVDQQLLARDEQWLILDREIASAREAIATSESTMQHQGLRCKEIDHELQRIRSQRNNLQRQVDLADQELRATSERLTSYETQFEQSRNELQSREKQLKELGLLAQERSGRVAELRKEQATVAEQQQKLTERLAADRFQEKSLIQNRELAQSRLMVIEKQIEEAVAEREKRESLLKDAEKLLQDRQDALLNAESSRGKLSEQREETERQLRDLRERRSAAEARLAVLEELEQRQEGIAIGVREILKRAESSHYPPWNRILGMVRDLVDVPLDLAPIVDAALGERAQLIAITDLEPLLSYLDKGAPPIEGRVGFVSIVPLNDRVTHEQVSFYEPNLIEIDFTGEPGVYGRADRLVQENERAKGLATRVLGDTWIVETLEVARSMLARSPHGTRFVTLQGEVLCKDLQLFLGTMPHESFIISRKSELRQLKNEIHQLNKGIESSTQRQAILREDLINRSKEADHLGRELKTYSNRVTECATRLAGQVQEIDRLESERNEQQGVIDQTEKQQKELEVHLLETQSEIEFRATDADELLKVIQAEEQQIHEVDALLRSTHDEIKTEQLELAKYEERLNGLRQTQTRFTRDQQQRRVQLGEAEQRYHDLRESRRRAQLEVLNASSRVAWWALQHQAKSEQSENVQQERTFWRERRTQLTIVEEAAHQERRTHLESQNSMEFEIQKIDHRLTSLAERIHEEYQITLEELAASGVSAYRDYVRERYSQQDDHSIEVETIPMNEQDSDIAEAVSDPDFLPAEAPAFEEVRAEFEEHVDRLRRKIKMIGNVNTEALENLEELEERFATLSSQLSDLQEAKLALEDIIRRINKESQRIFLETFEVIRGHFQELFRKLFGGGDADIILEDRDDVLECGIEIVARPPGKELRSLSLLSGGEKTMTAVAMLFAMFKSKPSPYCILDEVDAALDEANVDRYVTVLKEFVSMTQFVVITHRKRTMTAANALYGVTMEQAGVSKKVSVRFEDVNDNGEIRTAA